MSASNKNIDLDDAKNPQQKQPQQRHQQQSDAVVYHQPQITGMTPSIITTINNTSPHPPEDHYPSINYNNNNNNNNCNTSTRNSRRTNEPYESYIEDSFVGHWEREDDDTNYYNEYSKDEHHGLNREGHDEDEDSALQHASTIEFDFDSFGPESIIYTPAMPPSTTPATNKTAITTTPEPSATPVTVTPTNNCIPNNQGEIGSSNEVTEQYSSASKAKTTIAQEDESNPCPIHLKTPQSALVTNSADYLLDPTQIDLKVIEPYKKVISHAGYCHPTDPSATPPKPGEPAPAIIVFSACYLPDRSRRDYNYVMDHLFLYVLTSLHELIADDYILIYLHNTQPSNPKVNSTNSSSSTSTGSSDEVQHPNNLPTFTWIKRCYQIIDRKLRKNLKILYLVKPTFWLKTIVIMCKPFISSKFSQKLKFVENMDELKKCLPVDRLILPASADSI